MHLYLFEVKSVQPYLFASGKLKDVIAASERLDRLIDSSEHSTLYLVMKAAGLSSNLLKAEEPITHSTIGFIRCKGGAFYAWCHEKEPLQQLRSLWTLTVQQLFPGLEITDALVEGSSLSEALAKGHPQLAASRNTPSVFFPLGTAPTALAPRTGKAAARLSKVAAMETHQETSLGDAQTQRYIDVDTEQHRQAYWLLKLRQETLLSKFTGDLAANGFPEDIDFPLDFEKFPGLEAQNQSQQDMALLHIDGNGLGLLLRGLQSALRQANCSDHEFANAFRFFSDALDKATRQAAQAATKELYENTCAKTGSRMLPMRPIVLGGDDVTLFCHPEHALTYASTFCKTFKSASEKELKWLYNTYLKKAGNIAPYLTASGGILFHKASHPFITCHTIVESLCDEAKKTTKAEAPSDTGVGPSALAFYRLSQAVAGSISELRAQTQTFPLEKKQLMTSLGGYLVEPHKKGTNTPTLAALQRLHELLQPFATGAPAPLSVAKLRQMITELSQNNAKEAITIFERSANAWQKTNSGQWQDLVNAMQDLMPQQSLREGAEWLPKTNEAPIDHTWLSDVLIFAHFKPQETPHNKEVHLG